MVDSLEKNCQCVAVMIFNIYLHVSNEYSDSAIDQTCKYKVRINCNNFISVDSLLSIYNENMHQFLTNLLSATKQLEKQFELKHLFIYADFVGNNNKMTQVGFQTAFLFLGWK